MEFACWIIFFLALLLSGEVGGFLWLPEPVLISRLACRPHVFRADQTEPNRRTQALHGSLESVTP